MLRKSLLVVGLFVVSTSFAENVVCAPGSYSPDKSKEIKWYRDSAEQKALYNQGYSLATNYIRTWVRKHHPKAKTWGVVIDIDETALDNSWYYRVCGDNANDENKFSHYVVNPMRSTALPGVIAFTHLVHDLGGYVTMVSNRDGSFKDSSGSVLMSSAKNLKSQNIYFDQVVLANLHDSKIPYDKNPRFEAINSGKYDAKEMVWSNELPAYNVIAYLGDNIQDFPKFKQSILNQTNGDDPVFKSFGSGNFIMPNPMYGSWEANSYK